MSGPSETHHESRNGLAHASLDDLGNDEPGFLKQRDVICFMGIGVLSDAINLIVGFNLQQNPAD